MGKKVKDLTEKTSLTGSEEFYINDGGQDRKVKAQNVGVSRSELFTDTFVDLGLPSKTLWATCNLGATKPEEAGRYFQWGEPLGHSGGEACNHSSWRTAPFNGGYAAYDEASLLQAIAEGKIADNRLSPECDAAHHILGGNWRMPDALDFQELIDHTTNEWTSINGVNGRKFTSKSDASKFIFLPAAGGCDNGSYIQVNDSVYYWCSDLSFADKSKASYLASNSSRVLLNTVVRYPGYTIRPVTKSEPGKVLRPELVSNIVGNLDQLETGAKDTLVSAINSNKRSIDSFGTEVRALYDAVGQPIIPSPSIGQILRWYALMIRPDGTSYVHTNYDSEHLSYFSALLTGDDRFLWAFIGNFVDGFRIYNKQHRQFITCVGGPNTLALKTDTGSIFSLAPSTNANYPFPYFCLKTNYDGQTLYLNRLNSGIGMWTGTDVGSTFRAIPL